MYVNTRFLEAAGYVSVHDAKTVNRREIHRYVLGDRGDATCQIAARNVIAFLESNPAIIPTFPTDLDPLSRHLQEHKYLVINHGQSIVLTKRGPESTHKTQHRDIYFSQGRLRDPIKCRSGKHILEKEHAELWILEHAKRGLKEYCPGCGDGGRIRLKAASSASSSSSGTSLSAFNIDDEILDLRDDLEAATTKKRKVKTLQKALVNEGKISTLRETVIQTQDRTIKGLEGRIEVDQLRIMIEPIRVAADLILTPTRTLAKLDPETIGRYSGLIIYHAAKEKVDGLAETLIKPMISPLAKICANSMIRRVALNIGGEMTKEVLEQAAFTMLREGVKKGLKEKNQQLLRSVIAKKVQKVFVKAGTEKATKVVQKQVLDKIAKYIPVVGLGFGAWGAYSRWSKGQTYEAGLELASGVASCFPGVGTTISCTITAGLVAKDGYEIYQEIQAERDAVEAANRQEFARVVHDVSKMKLKACYAVLGIQRVLPPRTQAQIQEIRNKVNEIVRLVHSDHFREQSPYAVEEIHKVVRTVIKARKYIFNDLNMK